jgi:hypothetical protein
VNQVLKATHQLVGYRRHRMFNSDLRNFKLCVNRVLISLSSDQQIPQERADRYLKQINNDYIDSDNIDVGDNIDDDSSISQVKSKKLV